MSTERMPWQVRLSRWVAGRSRRERWLRLGTAALLLLALLLRLGIWPAWRMLQTAPLEQERLDGQWQQMQALQAQAASLLRQPRLAYSEADLRRSLVPLGEAARLEVTSRGAQLVLTHARPDAMAAWLVQARTQAGVRVREARLQRGQQDGQAVWSGTLVLDLAR